VHEGAEDHARPGWTTSRHGQDSCGRVSQNDRGHGKNGESMSMVWPTLGPWTAKEQSGTFWVTVGVIRVRTKIIKVRELRRAI